MYLAPCSLNVHTQVGGTCYANACATVIRAAELRIVGREPLARKALVDQIVARHGVDGGDVKVVLQEECPKRQLRFQDLGMTQAHGDRELQLHGIPSTLQHRAVLMNFHLDDDQWNNFSAFFAKHPTGILRAKDIGALVADATGHSVVVTGEGEKVRDGQVIRYWKCKNSWSAKFGDSGFFRIEHLAFRMRWFDVFFYQHELTPSDFHRFLGAPVRVSVVVKTSLHVIAKQLPGALHTGFKDGQRFDASFASLNAGQISCPCQAHPHGRGSFKDMYILQDSNGQCFALKLLRGNSSELEEELLKQVVAAGYASTFDAPQHRIKFCVPVIVEVEAAYDINGHHAGSWTRRCGLVEPFLWGSYTKFVFEQTIAPHDLPQAFFHHSYESSARQALVWDLQGVAEDGKYVLTDPTIVCGIPGRRSHLDVLVLQRMVGLDGTYSIFGDQHDTFRALHSCNARCAQLRVAPNVNCVHSTAVLPSAMHGGTFSDGFSDGPDPFEHYDYYSEPDYGPELCYSEPCYSEPDDGREPWYSEPCYSEPDDGREPWYS